MPDENPTPVADQTIYMPSDMYVLVACANLIEKHLTDQETRNRVLDYLMDKYYDEYKEPMNLLS